MPRTGGEEVVARLEAEAIDEAVVIARRARTSGSPIALHMPLSRATLGAAKAVELILAALDANRAVVGALQFRLDQAEYKALNGKERASLAAIGKMGVGLSLSATTSLRFDYAELQGLGFRTVRVDATRFLRQPESFTDFHAQDVAAYGRRFGMELNRHRHHRRKPAARPARQRHYPGAGTAYRRAGAGASRSAAGAQQPRRPRRAVALLSGAIGEYGTAMSSLFSIAANYDAILSDVWGVIHNGITPHASAVDALVKFRRGGGRVVLITNAPRAAAPIIDMLDGMGVPRAAYDGLVLSGDVTRTMIAPYRGRVIHHIGPATIDDSLYEGLGVIRGPAETAEAVIVTDLDTDDDTPETYRNRIPLWLKRHLPLICANPDRVVEHGGQIIYCGGALADLYEANGGRILMAGKPYRQIYDAALKMAEAAAGHPLDRGRILAIGDSVRTDAIGAANAGLDLMFITGSIHAQELDAFGAADPAAVDALVAPSGARLKGFMPLLAW